MSNPSNKHISICSFLFKTILAGLCSGAAFVVAAVIAYFVFAAYAHVEGLKEADAISLLSKDMSPPEPGFEMRAVTMLYWMFIGGYMAGYLFSSARGVPPGLGKKPTFVHLMSTLSGSLVAFGTIGWFILRSLGVLWCDWGGGILSIFMGLVLGSALYVWLSDRIPFLFPSREVKSTDNPKNETERA
jgi:hypothetical protein